MQCRKLICVVIFGLLLVTHSIDFVNASRTKGSNRKTSSNSHVTRPTHSTNTGANGDLAKLSYSNYNSQPNRPANPGTASQPAAPIGWNVPKQQGPPPAYSASNPVGGAKTNVYESPPSYGASGVHTPITATNAHSVQSGYPVQQGASYPGGYMPAAGNYAPAGHPGGYAPPAGGYYPAGGHMQPVGSYYPSAGVPPGATYLAPGASLPQGATYYAQPPQSSSSGLGLGTGLVAGALGGAILGHALTPTQTRVVEQAPANAGGGEDKIIIINNGPPGAVTTTQAGNGTTIITTGGEASPAPNNTPLAPMGAAAVVPNAETAAVNNSQPMPQQPPAGGIICVPVRVNTTDPADSSKMIEVEQVACYPAPPPPVAADANAQAVNGSTPLAPMNSNPNLSQQLQQSPTQGTLLPPDAAVHKSGSNALSNYMSFATTLLSLVLIIGIN